MDYTACRQLAALIITQACRDWRRASEVREFEGEEYSYPRLGFTSPREELIVFFNSQWFSVLATELDLPPEMIRRHYGIPEN